MTDALGNLTVETEREAEPDDRARLVWIGMSARDGRDLVRRKPVLLGVGRNDLVLRWTEIGTGIACEATLSLGPRGTPKYRAPLRPGPHQLMAGDLAALVWTITHNGGEI
jgi:hypothetical protein